MVGGVIGAYCLWCARSFVFAPSLEFSTGFPDEAVPVVNEWFESNSTFTGEEFAGDRFLKYLCDPYGKRAAVRAVGRPGSLFVHVEYEFGPSAKVYFWKREGIWVLKGIQVVQPARPFSPSPTPDPFHSDSEGEFFDDIPPFPGAESA